MMLRSCLLFASAAMLFACGSSDSGGGDTSGDEGAGGSDAAGLGGTSSAGAAGKAGASGGAGKAGAAGAAGKGGASGAAGKGGAAGASGGAAGGTAGKGGASGAGGGAAGKAGTGGAGGSGKAGASGAGTGGSATGGFEQARQLCLDTINMYRKSVNLSPYTRWTKEEQCVDQEATEDGMMNMPHHSFSTAHMCGGYGQNECPNYGPDPIASLPGCLAQMWAEKDSPACSGCGSCDFPFQGCTSCPFQMCGHYLNMKSTAFTTVACGFWSGGWYAQDFE
jgi:NAD-dependent dihydropyrimidine dehydrogenase PreA subunit